MADLLGQAIVNVDVRPIRAAYLITPRSCIGIQDSCRVRV